MTYETLEDVLDKLHVCRVEVVPGKEDKQCLICMTDLSLIEIYRAIADPFINRHEK